MGKVKLTDFKVEEHLTTKQEAIAYMHEVLEDGETELILETAELIIGMYGSLPDEFAKNRYVCSVYEVDDMLDALLDEINLGIDAYIKNESYQEYKKPGKSFLNEAIMKLMHISEKFDIYKQMKIRYTSEI